MANRTVTATPMWNMLCLDEFGKLIADKPPPPGQQYRLRVYATDTKRAVVERDIDLLSPQDFKDHAAEVRAATKEELETWIKHQ